MEITIFGTGYVGLVTGTCFAEMGNKVTCLDIDTEKLDLLAKGKSPIYEPGLDEMLERNILEKRMDFKHLNSNNINLSKLIFIAVGTPERENGEASLEYVFNVAEYIGKSINEETYIVTKSTVPVGTGDKIYKIISKCLTKRGAKIPFNVISNPEFLKEGDAIRDFMQPDRIIIGTDSHDAKGIMQKLYSSFSMKKDRLMFMGIKEAEMSKYAANAMLATKISFINEMASICDNLNIDIESVRQGIGSDTRIGYSFIYPGCGYGGSCFPKDVKAILHTAKNSGVDPLILTAVEQRNQLQKKVLYKKVNNYFNSDIRDKVISVWGLAFKPGTDDIRESPSLVLIKDLLNNGAIVQAYDPVAMPAAKEQFEDKWIENRKLFFCETFEDCVVDADAIVLVTEWKMFRNPNFKIIRDKMKSPVIFDGRNQFDLNRLEDVGFTYFGIGRKL